ncbi:exonuclease domain-containing protein [Streptomyces poriferorum]|uniref:Exonuclease domain-containing protein n=1 Tax=Streptomyces poriferorum TaxID=2798799 RepID=A0ABY9IZJ2_9ACTN|nr:MULTISPECIES: exonuclease domain-containing protein [unclassified Streptomyces]MDP5310461.1 exonuclease domain-containing protein [Streptomyces sp. Alt4]WLQ60385.1 exonuclease domain-containing protein [Streptomyces sp. Alt2]
MTWHLGRMAGFDIESTGTDPETARIVTACIVQVGDQKPTVAANWLTDVDGEEIPAGAAAVHGISTEKARADGVDLRQAVEEISAALAQVILAGVPVVAMNARYDLSLLDREIQRFGFDPLPDGPVIDPLVLDKHVDTYRAGKRTLTHLCQHYQVKLDAAHSADADAVAACRVAWRQAAQYPQLAGMNLDELHTAQIGWAAEQAASLQEHFRKKDPEAVVEGAWPLIPRQRETTS